jgi:hypothetical protein
MSTADPAAPAPPSTTTPTTPPPDPTGASAPASDPGRTFTQSEVDRLIQERLQRAKATPPADYEDLKAAAAKLAEYEAAQLSEQERLQKAAQEAEARATAATERAQQAILRSSVVSAAQRAGAVDPDAVMAFLDKSKVTIGDDDQVAGVDEAVKAVLESKPYLVGKPPTPTPGGADSGVRDGMTSGSFTREQLRDPEFYAANKAAILQAANEGRIT